ncbi:PQQ-dependent sugar dehydrogenase [Nocardia sp. NPDC127579]|uniref:PQQ-dependent sugar dehydrogenase n=1 Tax=Nocardia sp. NPDC127579 TaxID=3345402 RepID=UPI0036382F5C
MSARRRAPVLVALTAILAACAGPEPASSPTSTPESPAPIEEIARGLEVPWGLAFLPDGAALVSERDSGRVLRVGRGEPEQVHQVSGVVARGEGGLLGLAVARDYAETGLVYAYFTGADDNRIVRFRPGGPQETVFSGIAKAGNHNGGRIAFGPDDMLYVGTGDAGAPDRSPDPTSPNGKILRITPDGRPAPGNPTPGSPVYSRGHRNVQGLAWDASGRLFAAEFGQNRLDEINIIEPGNDYGWPAVEGTGGTARGSTDPVLTWPTSAASPSGIAIAGTTLYAAALRGERLWTATLTGDTLVDPRALFHNTYGRLRTIATAPDGTLWLTTSNTDGRGTPDPADDRILRFPAMR